MGVEDPLANAFFVAHLVTGSISLVLNGFALYATIFYSGKTGKEYSKYVIAAVLMTAISDSFTSFGFHPIPLFPLPCLYTNGLLYRIFGIHAGHLFAIEALLLEWNVPVFFACFFYRHQAVMPPNSMFIFSNTTFRVIVIVLTITFSAGSICLFLAGFHSEEAIQEILQSPQQDPVLVSIVESSNSVTCYSLSGFTLFWAFLVHTVFIDVLCIVLVVLIVVHIFRALNEQHSAMSAKTREYHRLMTRTLIVQAGIPVICLLLPILIIMVQIIARYQNEWLTLMCVQLISIHAALHSLTTLLLTPSYRRFLYSLMPCTRSELPEQHESSTSELSQTQRKKSSIRIREKIAHIRPPSAYSRTDGAH